MLRRIDIGNLRSFSTRSSGDGRGARMPHELPLWPITLVYGPNSSGKSSLIQGLALLKQTLASDAAHSSVRADLNLRGGLVDLGSFLTAVHAHDPQNELMLGVEVAGRSRVSGDRASVYAGLGFTYDAESRGARQSAAVIGDGTDRLRFAYGDRAVVLEGASRASLAALLEESAKRADDADRRDDYHAMAKYVRRRRRALPFQSRGVFPSAPMPGIFDSKSFDRWFASWFVEQIYDRLGAVNRSLASVTYVGPVRTPPTRFQPLTSSRTTDVGISGERTARLLADDPKLVADVNRWLETLEIGYTLSVTNLRPEAPDVVVDDLVVTSLFDERMEIFVTPMDVGYGVSQLLPVVVQLLVNTDAIICIEQPEVHIHPRLQAHVGDLIIESASRGNQLIVETHSEQLMLRLQRRLREGNTGLRGRDVGILYIDRGGRGAAVPTVITLDDGGSFSREWPDGFFGESLEDLISGGTARKSIFA